MYGNFGPVDPAQFFRAGMDMDQFLVGFRRLYERVPACRHLAEARPHDQ